MNEISVINRRAPRPAATMVVNCGRPSRLGNPFVIGRDGTREDVIAKYGVWLDEQLDGDTPAQDMFCELLVLSQRQPRLALSCWCAPLPCHCDLIKERMEEILDPHAQREEDEAVFWKEVGFR